MPVSTELLNTTLADLKGPLQNTFAQKTPLYDLLQKAGRVSTDRGILIERMLSGESPSQGTGVFGGGETLNMGRNEIVKKIQIQTHRLVVPINIPKLDLKQNEGKLGAIKLLELYPKQVQDLIPADFDRFWATGVSHGKVFQTSELTGLNTLNGQKVFSSGKVGVTTGLIDLDNAPSAQTATVQNLAKSLSYGYYNQRAEITSYAMNGRKTYLKVARDCGQWNMSSPDATIDVMLMDFDSYARDEETESNQVVIVDTSKDMYGGKKTLTRRTMSGIEVRAAKNIVLTDFTGAAAEGVVYCLTTSGMELIWFQKPEMSDFDDRVSNQDVVTAKLEMQFALTMQGMNMQGVVVGGNRA